jgi:hypothetical protein
METCYDNRNGAPCALKHPHIATRHNRFARHATTNDGFLPWCQRRCDRLTGLPQLAHGQDQSLPVDFSRLSNHPSVRPAEDEQVMAEVAAPAEEAPPLPADQAPLSEAPAEPITVIDENRALWVEPGYLIMLTWQRPDDATIVAALEGSAQAVQDFLSARVTQVDQLHNIEQLHGLEGEVLVLLESRVAPAHITVLHLDRLYASVRPWIPERPTPMSSPCLAKCRRPVGSRPSCRDRSRLPSVEPWKPGDVPDCFPGRLVWMLLSF